MEDILNQIRASFNDIFKSDIVQFGMRATCPEKMEAEDSDE